MKNNLWLIFNTVNSVNFQVIIMHGRYGSEELKCVYVVTHDTDE